MRSATPPFFAGYENAEFIPICVECGDIDPPVSVIRDGRRGPVVLITPWDAEDHKWFTANPRRQFRLRAPVAGEPCLDVSHAAERIAEARRSGLIVAVLVWWDGVQFVREPGTFSIDVETMDSFTDAGIERLIEPAPVQATTQCVLH